MKKEYGFTLIELLAVIALIALLGLVIVPSVLNLFNKNKPKIDSVTKKLVYAAAESYLDANQSTYIKANGAIYCPILNNLIETGFLEENLVNMETGEKYDTSLYVKSTYNNGYSYEITNDCNVLLPDTSKPYIIIDSLTFKDKNGNEKSNIYYNVDDMDVTVLVKTHKIDTDLMLKLRKGSSYISGWTGLSDSYKISDNQASITFTTPRSASLGEYVIEVIGNNNLKATKNFKISVNPIILFMGD